MPCLAQLLARQAFGIAAQQNVDAAPGHVGGDGDGARPPGLRDDDRLLLVLLGVEHLVRHARAASACADSISEVSMATVPTSTGRPCLVQLGDLVDHRVELALAPS